jgi:CheY-like chemotaxis protein/two-component sensor histidine kinase
MLAFARRQDLAMEAVDIAELVKGMSDLLQRSLGAQISVEIDIPADLDHALSDPNQLEAAILNLAVNARDALDGEGRIRISAREETLKAEGPYKAGQYVCVSVSDNGPGMDAQTLSRATEPFFTTKGVGRGTGLGLSMVQGVAEQSGGRLVLKSGLGQGTTAEIWLPVAQGEVRAVVEAPEPVVNQAPTKLRVVAVDDDALVLLNTVALLEDLGHSVVSAYSASEALDAVKSQKVDLVITDFSMPGTNGAQLAEAIHVFHPELPVILATGYAELPPGFKVDMPRLGKPFSQDDLARAIAGAIRTPQPA